MNVPRVPQNAPTTHIVKIRRMAMTVHVAQATIELQILVVVLTLMNVKVKTCAMAHWVFVQTLMVDTRK